jgi:DNA-binding MarR family transcriptional regulator
MTPQAMSEVIAALAGKGFVRREANPKHGRVIHTRLTRAGAAALAACDEAVDRIERQMLAELDGAGAERLRADLASCVRSLGAGLTES